MQTDENTITEQIKGGNKKAFETVFRSLYNPLCAYANRFTNDTLDSEEIVQEIFFQFWQKRADLNIQTSLKSYLFRSIHNSCLNYIKQKNVQLKHAQFVLNHQANETADFSTAIDTSELQGKIRSAIDKLPSERKKIFLMIRFQNLKYAEVAGKLGISVKTVENQMGSALKFMREELKDYLPTIIILMIILTFFKIAMGVHAYLIVI